MPTRIGPIKARYQERETREAALAAALQRAKQQAKTTSYSTKNRLDTTVVTRHVALPMQGRHVLRPVSDYKITTYNRARQVRGLVDHLFVRFPVPSLLYRVALTNDGQELVFGNVVGTPPEAASWFYAVAQGRSLADLTSHCLNRAEAHWFLLAPDDLAWNDALLWAKARAGGMPDGPAKFFARDYAALWTQGVIGSRLGCLIEFYKNHFADALLEEEVHITRFLREALRNPEFTLRGRTYNSIKKLAKTYERTWFNGHVAKFEGYRPKIAYWEIIEGDVGVRALQLVSNRLLAAEATHMQHCVFGYCWDCANSDTQIVSMRWHPVKDGILDRSRELSRITIEVANGEIEQAKGRQNRLPSGDERTVILRWAKERGIAPRWVR